MIVKKCQRGIVLKITKLCGEKGRSRKNRGKIPFSNIEIKRSNTINSD